MAPKWTRNSVLLLINLYEQNPFLYDFNHAEFYNRRKRSLTFLHFTKKIRELSKVKVTVEDIKGKIKTLRSQYSKEMKYPDASSLWCFQNLSFLEPFSGSRNFPKSKPKRERREKEKRTKDKKIKEWKEEESTDSSDDSDSDTDKIKKRKTSASNTPKPSKKPIRKEDVFGHFVMSQLKQISNEHIYNEVVWKMKIALKVGMQKQMVISNGIDNPSISSSITPQFPLKLETIKIELAPNVNSKSNANDVKPNPSILSSILTNTSPSVPYNSSSISPSELPSPVTVSSPKTTKQNIVISKNEIDPSLLSDLEDDDFFIFVKEDTD